MASLEGKPECLEDLPTPNPQMRQTFTLCLVADKQEGTWKHEAERWLKGITLQVPN